MGGLSCSRALLFLLFLGLGARSRSWSRLGVDGASVFEEISTSVMSFGSSSDGNQSEPIKTIVLKGEINATDTRWVNRTIEYVYQYTFYFNSSFQDVFDEDIRVHVQTNSSDLVSPILFVVRQQKAVLSWPLPVRSKFDNKLYQVASRTLCGEAAEVGRGRGRGREREVERTIFVSVSTASDTNLSFSILVSLEHNFIMKLDKKWSTEVSPLSPRFYRFVFPEEPEEVELTTSFVLLEVSSEDERCMTVSVQNASCPILDQENNVQFEGYWQTMTKQAGMTLRREDFPLGFYVIFVMHGDNSRCEKVDSETGVQYGSGPGSEWSAWPWFDDDDNARVKNVSFVVQQKISDFEYLSAIFGTVGIFMIFYVFSFIVSCAYFCRSTPMDLSFEEEAVAGAGAGNGQGYRNQNQNCPSTSTSTVATATIPQVRIRGNRILPPGTDADAEAEDNHNGNGSGHHQEEEEMNASVIDSEGFVRNQNPRSKSRSRSRSRISGRNLNVNNCEDEEERHWLADSDSSLDETEIDMLEDAYKDKNVFRTATSICVAALARKNPRVLAKKSQLYLWTLLTVAIFYALPVVQLVFTYQNVLHTTGNQDLCYYNYLCSHPLWILSDFNHVYSNIGYIMLGILFLLLVARRERMHSKLAERYPHVESHCGIPRHFGLFYAMGVALIMEGVLSACYHVCPNHSNFQFDTCFMYVNAMLLMLKIYQTRHPDINASAYMAFSALAIVVLLGVIGVLAGSLFFRIFFTILHIGVCSYLSIQIYYLGRWRLDLGIFQRMYNTCKQDCLAGPLRCLCLRPLYLDRMILLTIVNVSNWAIAWFGIYHRTVHDFATHLLLIFMANLFLYSTFYIIMKLTHREKITFQPAVYIVLSVVFWCLAMFVFLQRSTSWQLTPAQSRTFNRECMLLRFYDTHDIWHFLSAASMFFSFMILLTLDDDLVTTPRTKIPVF